VRRTAAAGLLLAAGLAGCVSQDVAQPDSSGWSFAGDAGDGLVVAGGAQEPQDLPEPTAAEREELLALLEPASEKDLEPDFLSDQPPSPFHRLGRNVIRGIDGSWSRIYSLKSERSDGVIRMLQATVPGFPVAENVAFPADGKPTEITKWVLHKDFFQDTTGKIGIREPLPNVKIADMLVVTAPPETLLFIDQLLDKLLADLPQIEMQVRVVEINLDDLIEWDTKVGASKLQDPDAPFDPVNNPVDGNFGAGFPINDNGGDPTGYGLGFGSFTQPDSLTGFLLSLQGVHNGLQVDALLSLLQTIGASEIILSPTITVLNGHRALINTGSEVPVFSATGVGTSAQVTTVYKPTGVKVELVPFILSEDVIRVDVSVDVSAVTGQVPFNLAGTEVLTPVISTRDAGTTVHVHSGQVFALGGLRSRDSIETITKVPVLGDIPVLGWLFKSRSSRVRNSEIVFFITPTIRIPSETLVAPLGS
jgi:type II secretory pathway component GspD/PulD (secretin)